MLAVVLPDCNVAVYLDEGGSGELRLRDHTASDNRFITSVPLDKLSFSIQLEGGDLQQSLVASDNDMRLFLSKKRLKKDVSLFASPMVADDKLEGLLVVALPEQGVSPSAVAWQEMAMVARIVQLNLAREDEIGSLQQYNDFISDLMERGRQIDIAATQDEILATIAEVARESMDFDLLTISLKDQEATDSLKVVWSDGKRGALKKGSNFSPEGGYHGAVYLQVQPISAEDMSAGDFSGRFVPDDVGAGRLKSFLGVPVVEAGSAHGTIAIEGSSAGQFSALDMQKLGAISHVFGTALCWVFRYSEIHALATIDGLTELLNSRTFLQRMSEELERDVRYGNEMTMLMLDIDQFKQVNDTHGHLYGDYVIRQTASLIRSSIRVADVAGRLGGEEFGVVIINSDSGSSRKTADRIKQSIADYNFSSDGIEAHITISIGMSEYPVHGKSVKEIVKHADQAMYAVKHSGGNGVKSFNELQK